MTTQINKYVMTQPHETRPRFAGDPLTSKTWNILLKGKQVASIQNLAYKPRFNVTVNQLRWAGLIPPTQSADTWRFYDSGPFDSLEQAFEWACQQCDRMLEWRAQHP
jgi:hypothetical protein